MIDKKHFIYRNGFNFLRYESKITILNIARKALDRLYDNQRELFQLEVSELTIQLHYIRIFDELFLNEMNQSHENVNYHCDQNYNRSKGSLKYVDHNDEIGGWTSFDYVIHQRGYGDNNYPENLVHFEFKKASSTMVNRNEDILRLKATTLHNNHPLISRDGYIQENGRYLVRGYQLGIFIIFDLYRVRIIGFNNGREMSFLNQSVNHNFRISQK